MELLIIIIFLTQNILKDRNVATMNRLEPLFPIYYILFCHYNHKYQIFFSYCIIETDKLNKATTRHSILLYNYFVKY